MNTFGQLHGWIQSKREVASVFQAVHVNHSGETQFFLGLFVAAFLVFRLAMYYRRGIRDLNFSSLLCLDQMILRNFISRKGVVLAWPFRVENFPEMKLRDIA